MIVFRKLRWQNFLSTGNIFTEIELDKHSSTLIIGENGAGKSTILDALSYALFGKPFRKINKPQLLNSITRKGLIVEIEFDISPNKYKIVRGMKPNVFEVYQNGNLLNQSADMKDYQDILEKQILKINHKSFNQVVVLGAATFQPFMQLSSSNRREVIEDLLDLQIFTKMNVLLKDKVSSNNEKIVEIQADQRVINERIKIIKEHLHKAAADSEEVIEEKSRVISDTKVEIKALKKNVKDIEDKLIVLTDSISDRDDIEDRIEKIKKIRIEIDAKIKNLDADIEFFKDKDHCPTCTQTISTDFREKMIDERKSKLDEIREAAPKLLEQFKNTRERLAEIMETNSVILDHQMDLHRCNVKINALMDYINALQKEINGVVEKSQKNDDDQISELERDLKEFEDKYSDLVDEKNVLTVASSLLKDGGIKARIIKQYIPIINKLINKYLSAMDFFVQFELDEEFNETIKSRYRDEFSYSSFSEGEKVRINLAILFTWRAIAKLRNSINTNLLIMDEVFDSSLDSNGTDEFMKIVNELTSDTNTFIISHKGDQLIDKFENLLKFKKVKNFSQVSAS